MYRWLRMSSSALLRVRAWSGLSILHHKPARAAVRAGAARALVVSGPALPPLLLLLLPRGSTRQPRHALALQLHLLQQRGHVRIRAGAGAGAGAIRGSRRGRRLRARLGGRRAPGSALGGALGKHALQLRLHQLLRGHHTAFALALSMCPGLRVSLIIQPPGGQPNVTPVSSKIYIMHSLARVWSVAR